MKNTKLSIGFVLLVLLIGFGYFVLAESSQEIYLTNDNPAKELTLNDKAYTVELVSASTSSATIKVTDNTGASATKEISENQTKQVGALNIKVKEANANNYVLSTVLIVERVESAISSSGSQAIQCIEDSDGGKNYYVKGTVNGNKSYTDSCTYCTGLCPDNNPNCEASCGALIEYYCQDSQMKKEIKSCDCNEGVCTGANIDDNSGNSFTLTNGAPKKSISVAGESYSVELVSASATTATIKVSQTKTIKYSEKTSILGVPLKVYPPSSAGVDDSRVSRDIDFPVVEDAGDGEHALGLLIEINNNTATGIENVNRDPSPYSLIIVSVADNTATIRASQTKEIAEGDSKNVGGVNVMIKKADATNEALSASLVVRASIRGEEASSKKEVEEEVEEIKPNDETGPIDIPDKENVVCDGCTIENSCYPLGYRKSGEFCSESKEFTLQLQSGQSCENNFECSSNICVSGECISEGLIKKVLNWFKRLFGFD